MEKEQSPLLKRRPYHHRVGPQSSIDNESNASGEYGERSSYSTVTVGSILRLRRNIYRLLPHLARSAQASAAAATQYDAQSEPL